MRVAFFMSLTLLLTGCGGGPSSSWSVQPPATGPSLKLEIVASVPAASGAAPSCDDTQALGLATGASPPIAASSAGEVFVPAFCQDTQVSLVGAIRRIATDGRITTFALGNTAGAGELLNSYLDPKSLALDASGNLLVSDGDTFYGGTGDVTRVDPGRGPGVWRIDPQGNVRRLAGVVQPMQYGAGTVDGSADEVVFSYMSTMCAGSDGAAYVEGGYVRRITTDGRVSTVMNDQGKPLGALLSCGAGGLVLAQEQIQDAQGAAVNRLLDVVAGRVLWTSTDTLTSTLVVGATADFVVAFNRSAGNFKLLDIALGTEADVQVELPAGQTTVPAIQTAYMADSHHMYFVSSDLIWRATLNYGDGR